MHSPHAAYIDCSALPEQFRHLAGDRGYFVYFAGISPTAQNVTIIVAVAMPLVLTLINLKGIKEASGTNNLLVGIKVYFSHS